MYIVTKQTLSIKKVILNSMLGTIYNKTKNMLQIIQKKEELLEIIMRSHSVR